MSSLRMPRKSSLGFHTGSTASAGASTTSSSSSTAAPPAAASESGPHAESANATSVQVAVRIRPINPHDVATIPPRWQKSVITPASSQSIQVEAATGPPPTGDVSGPAASGVAHKRQGYTFDRVLGQEDGQEDVYGVAQPFVSRFLEGYNVTVLAYGQTSSGKSYTMGTSAADVDFESLVAGHKPDPQVGIIPRAVAEVFTRLRQAQTKNNGIRFTAKASFVEIYNEELIDLLADTEGENRPLVQIREDKQGHIFWSGLREAKVNSVTDVMNLLLQGSAIRRTNETEMNAQSSRSHAIFSLNLVQQKFVGAGPPPPPSAALNSSATGGGRSTPSGGRTTPSSTRTGLPRPSSFLPQPSRSMTPSSLGRGSAAGMRPASTLGVSSPAGQRSASPMFGAGGSSSDTTQEGDWVTVSSKFHFVDLAGSERLKRTAAQGERAKEGISINAGLHALGNVISALGDPAKAKRTTHIPYRDSKLTRLLQDSLGGNACTLMIACVAPTEFNVGETINTLQYANRARNIKNRAERNEVEQGWDDVEHLQQTVKRLRKQIAALRGGKGGSVGDAVLVEELNAEILQWQGKFTETSQRASQLTAELTKLQQATTRNGDANEDFLAAAEPIIVEYEKTVDAMEGEINLLKAAGSYHEDLINEQEERIAQQEERILQAEQQLETRESTIVELQARLAKVQDRETTAEAYTRELEGQLAALSNEGQSTAESSAELRKDVARMREEGGNRESYIKDLEERLAKADGNVATLRAQVERLEKDLERRDESFQELQERLDKLVDGGDTKALAEDYQRSEQSNLELRAELETLQTEREGLIKERGNLHDAAAAHELQRGQLEDRVRGLEVAVAAASAGPVAKHVTAAVDGPSETADSTGKDREELAASAPASDESLSQLRQELEALRAEVQAARQAEAQAKTQTEVINAKYQENLTEMHALNLQLSEAKLTAGPQSTPKLRIKTLDGGAMEPEEELEVMASTTDVDDASARPGLMRRTSSQTNQLRSATATLGSTGDRASVADERRLHRRSSGSFFGYNPQQGGLDSPSRRERPRSLSQSLSQELLPALSGGHRPLSLSGNLVPPSPTGGMTPSWGLTHGASSGLNGGRSPDGRSGPPSSNHDRKVAMLEKGIMSLQEALKKRDAEIAHLEANMRGDGSNATGAEKLPSLATSATMVPSSSQSSQAATDPASEVDTSPDDESPAASQLSVYDTPGPPTPAATEPSHNLLTPVSEREFATIKQMLADSQADSGGDVTGDHLGRLDALIRSMARKEEAHRERSDALSQQLQGEQARREEAERRAEAEAAALKAEVGRLQTLVTAQDKDSPNTPKASAASSADDTLIASELAALRSDLAAAKAQLTERESAFEQQLQAIRNKQADVLSRSSSSAVEPVEQDRMHSEALARLTAEHQAMTEKMLSEHQNKLDSVIAEHAEASAARDGSHGNELAKVQAALAETVSSHERSVGGLKSEHSERIATLEAEHASALASELAAKDAAHEQVVQGHKTQLQALQDAHASDLVKAREAHEAALEQHKSEAAAALAAAVASTSITAESAEESDKRAPTAAELEELRSEHAKAVAELQDRADSDRQQALADAHTAYSNERQRMLDEHQARIADLKREHSQNLDQLSKRLSTFRDVHGEIVDVDALRVELSETSDALVTLEDALTSVTAERDEFAAEVEQLRGSGGGGAGSAAEAATLRKDLDAHRVTLANLKTELQRSRGEVLLLMEERSRQDQALRETQERMRDSRDLHGPTSPMSEEGPLLSMNGSGSVRGSKQALPPPTPPPAMPVPPTPTVLNGGAGQRSSAAGARTSLSSLMTRSDSPGPGMASGTAGTLTRSSSATSMHTHTTSINGLTNQDAKKLLADQSEELKNLAKQLSHCEADLQANIDLVATLEAALNDSERNLRKSRVQLGEVTRERDRYASQSEDLRQQVTAAQREAETVRNSVLLEKQSFERKIREERQAKEKAARDLELQLEEINRKKSSKLFCM
ncbi:unnamed protein product [Parajaminaea phylloscopi]